MIGRHGRTAEALRTIFSAARMKLHRHVTVEILDGMSMRGAISTCIWILTLPYRLFGPITRISCG
ncbi:MAG: hypothetical protein DMG40_24545 [Acidobacteria bacterium]|nr:MAG: hypothetical protein DMG40_24545 [Acidobacteriota bacterium]